MAAAATSNAPPTVSRRSSSLTRASSALPTRSKSRGALCDPGSLTAGLLCLAAEGRDEPLDPAALLLRQRAVVLDEQRHRRAVASPGASIVAKRGRDPDQSEPAGELTHRRLRSPRRRLAPQHRDGGLIQGSRDGVDRIELAGVESERHLTLTQQLPRPAFGRGLECGGWRHEAENGVSHARTVAPPAARGVRALSRHWPRDGDR